MAGVRAAKSKPPGAAGTSKTVGELVLPSVPATG